MARISYSDDESYPGEFALYRGNVNRCLQGKRGQAALRDLRDALLALPEKRLISRAIAADGEVCAIGAALVNRAAAEDRQALLEELQKLDDYEDTTEWAPKDYPHLMAWAVVEENDMSLENATPERRYELMLQWVEDRLAGKSIVIWY